MKTGKLKSGAVSLKGIIAGCGLVLVMSAVLPALVWAATEGGEHGGGSSAMDWVWKVVNFAILVILLVKFAGKPLKNFLQQRKELIEK
ncbi:MAG: ATP synthase F0 subunit B, partial [Chloroflexota bacterium]